MVNVIKQEIGMEESLKRRLDIICNFCNTTPKIINGSIQDKLEMIEKLKITLLMLAITLKMI